MGFLFPPSLYEIPVAYRRSQSAHRAGCFSASEHQMARGWPSPQSSQCTEASNGREGRHSPCSGFTQHSGASFPLTCQAATWHRRRVENLPPPYKSVSPSPQGSILLQECLCVPSGASAARRCCFVGGKPSCLSEQEQFEVQPMSLGIS